MQTGRAANRQSVEDFKGSENNLCDVIMKDICHFALVQTHRIYNTKGDPQVNYRLLIILCQYRFVLGKKLNKIKCTILVSDTDHGKCYTCVGQKIYRKSLYLPLKLYRIPKPTKNIKSFFFFKVKDKCRFHFGFGIHCKHPVTNCAS